MSLSQTSFVAIYVEAPDRVEHLGSYASLLAAKRRASEHFSILRPGRLQWHDEHWGGSRARHLNSEYLIRELEWEDLVTPPHDLSDPAVLVRAD